MMIRRLSMLAPSAGRSSNLSRSALYIMIFFAIGTIVFTWTFAKSYTPLQHQELILLIERNFAPISTPKSLRLFFS